MQVVITMGKIETGHIHSGVDQSPYARLAGNRGTEGGDDLGLALHLGLTLTGSGSHSFDPGRSVPGYEESFSLRS
jgi:hypothetical protein